MSDTQTAAQATGPTRASCLARVRMASLGASIGMAIAFAVSLACFWLRFPDYVM
jgi:hypothetical protein